MSVRNHVDRLDVRGTQPCCVAAITPCGAHDVHARSETAIGVAGAGNMHEVFGVYSG